MDNSNFKYLIECENLEEFFSKGLKFQKKVQNETQFIYSIIFYKKDESYDIDLIESCEVIFCELASSCLKSKIRERLKNIDFVENDNDEFYKIIIHSTDNNLEIYVDDMLGCIEKIIVGGDFKVYQQIKQYINSLVPTKKIKINSSMFED